MIPGEVLPVEGDIELNPRPAATHHHGGEQR